MKTEDPDGDIVGRLAESFIERYRRGERPALGEYAERYPEAAGRIRELFPALILLEELAPDDADPAGEFRHGRTAGAPEQLGDYRILREIGRGGMGVVYEAEQQSLGRHVALKVLPGHALLDPRQLERFRREARAAARLHHTNIVPVFGDGQQDGLHYYVMQFIHGLGFDEVLDELRRLREAKTGTGRAARDEADRSAEPEGRSHSIPSAHRMAEALITGRCDHSSGGGAAERAAPPSGFPLRGALAGPGGSSSGVHLPAHSTLSDTGRQYWQSVTRIGVQVAEALAYAHSQGVLHRDIKPSNLLLDADGTVWVTDFGLAKADDSDNLTYTGDVVGTLRYLAPERFKGDSDQRSEIYSLGVTLYELLTLRPAFPESDRNKLVRQVSQDEPCSPRSVDPSVPLDLETVVLKAMAKDPSDRYPTAAALGEDLRRFLADRPVLARRARPLERAWRWCRRNQAVASLSATLLFVFLVGFAGVVWKWREAEQARRQERMAHEEADRRADEVREGLERLNAANAQLDRAHVYIDWRRWDDADAALTKAIALRPDHAPAWEHRSELYTRLGLWDLAAHDAARAFELHEPALAWDWLGQAVLRIRDGDRAGYGRLCARMRDRYGGSTNYGFLVELVRTLGLTPDGCADPAAVLELVEASAVTNPHIPSFLYTLAMAQYRAGHYEQSVRCCRESLEGDWNGRAINYPVLAMAYHRLGQADQADQALRDAARAIDGWTQQRYEDGRENWVIHLGATGLWPIPWVEWLEARLHYAEARELMGLGPAADDHRLHMLRGRGFAGLRWPEQAEAEYAAALRLAPSEPQVQMEAQRHHGYYYLDRGEFNRAAAAFAAASRLEPQDTDLPRFEAKAYLAARNFAAYHEVCSDIVERFGDTADPAEAHDVVDSCVHTQDALPDMARLIPIARLASTWYPGAVRLLGAANYRAGHYDDAVRCFEQAAGLYRPRAGDWLLRAMSQQQRGNSAEAQRCLANAREWITQANRQELDDLTGTRPAWGDWYERNEVRLLQDEAAAVLGTDTHQVMPNARPRRDAAMLSRRS